MPKFVRQSKYRHVYGQPAPKDGQFEGVEVSDNRLEGNFVACNSKFYAVVLKSSGAGVFTALRRDKPGRYENLPRCTGHTSAVLDLSFDPFCSNRIASGSDDGVVKFWYIPDEGLVNNMDECLASIQPSQRRIVQTLWHPSASNIFFVAALDSVQIWDVDEYSLILEIDTAQYSDVYNISTNSDGSKLAIAFKDKKVRIFNTSNGKMESEIVASESTKPLRVQYISGIGNYMCTTGFTKMSERSINIWNLDAPSKPVCSIELDTSSAYLNIFYDMDSSLLAFFSKGSSSIFMYEVDATGSLYTLNNYQQGDQQKAACFGNKFACDINSNEVMHFVKCSTKCIEPIQIIVPRKSSQFQDDLYPPTASDQAAITHIQFKEGKRQPPLKINLKDYVSEGNSFTPVKVVPVNNAGNSGINRSATLSMARRPNDLEQRVKALEEKVDLLMKKLN